MAVEIPVVIDIEGAFKKAAEQVKTAAKPLETTIEKLSEQLSEWTELSKNWDLGDKEFKTVVKTLEAYNEQLARATYLVENYRSEVGSIRQYSNALSEISRQWTNMGEARKYVTAGDGSKKLSEEAQKLLTQYKDITAEISKQGQSLAQLAAEEQRILQLKNRGRSIRQYENAILNTTVKTMRVLQEQERILSERLSRTKIGSDKYNELLKSLQQVRLEISKAQKDINGLDDANKKLAKSTTQVKAATDRTNASFLKQSAILSQLKSLAGMYVSIFGGIRLIRNIRETTAELELQQVALGSILRDTEMASDLFRQIKAAALRSPFEIKDLITYTKQLAAYRVETDKLFDVTKQLADVSAGLGVDMNRLILAYGQVRAASVLRGQELRQFTEAGIPLVDLLAKKFEQLGREGTTTADVFELISKRAVPFSMIEDIFNDMTSAGEMFYNMQEKQSETLKGQWMKLKDAITIMYDEIGNTDAVRGGMEWFIQTALKLARNWQEVARLIGVVIQSYTVYAVVSKAAAVATATVNKAEAARLAIMKKQQYQLPKFIAAILSESKAKELSAKRAKQLAAAEYELAIANGVVEKSLYKLKIAMLTNEFALLAAAIMAVVAGIVAFVKKSKEAKITTDSLSTSLEEFNRQAQKTNDIFKLIETYETLTEKAELTAEEQQQLARATKELSKAFPNAVNGINKETGALEINIKKVRELTQAENELRLAKLRGEARAARERIEQLEKERDRILEQYASGTKTKVGAFSESVTLLPLSEDDLAEMGARIEEINGELFDLKDLVEEIDELDFIGPMPKPSTKAELEGWRKKLQQIHDDKVKAGAPQLFSPNDIESLEDIYALYKKMKTETKEIEENVAGLKAIQATLIDPDDIAANKKAIALEESRLDLANAINNAFGFTFKKESAQYTQDPFIDQMQERMKFMQDFKKGYDNLRKYMNTTAALDEQSKNMLKRGLSLGVDAATQRKAAEQLTDWYDDAIKEAFKQAQKHGAGADLNAFLSRQITGSGVKDKALRDFQKLLQSLLDAQTDLKTDELTKNLKKAFDKAKEEMKRSETVRNFYKDILDSTGDEEIARNISISVYGGVGEDFKERLQHQLDAALASLDSSKITQELRDAFKTPDFDKIFEYIDEFDEATQDMLKRLRDDNEKYNADWVKDIVKTYQKSKTYQERITDVQKKEAQKRKEISESAIIPPDEKEMYLNASRKKEAQEIAEIQLEARKDTYTWTKAFEDLDGVSDHTLRNLISLINDYIALYGKDLEPQQLKELVRQRELAEQQLISRNSYLAVADAIGRLTRAQRLQRKMQKNGLEETEAYTKEQDDERKAIKDLEDAFASITSQISTTIDATKALLSTFASSEDAEYFSEQLDNLSNAMSGVAQASVGVARLVANPLDPSAWVQAFQGLASIVSSIANMFKAKKLKEINAQIDDQQVILRNLEKEYNRLEKAIASAFGSDYIYNYNEQLKNLEAQVVAYREQARLEAEKGKGADQDKIKGYEDAIEQAESQMEEMQGQLATFFAGTDVTSAAKDFASAWIEAYKSFGSTTTAMKEKFQDMIESMISQSLASKMMQTILDPLFKEIDDMAKSGGELSAEEIATIAQQTPEYIDRINDAMNSLMTQLLGAGYNVRQQSGNLTGIARSAAGASEESINGLAAGINTLLYYQAYLPTISMDVAAIRAAIAGDSSVKTQTDRKAMYATSFGDEIFRGQMRNIDANIASILLLLQSTTSVKGNNTSVRAFATQ